MRLVSTITLLLLSLTCVKAETPEDAYIAARDAAMAKIGKLEARNPPADTSKLTDEELAKLRRRLEAIVGGLDVKPYPARGKNAQTTLSQNDVGAGGLDALLFAKGDDNGPRVYVTTDGLMTRYLAKPEDWWKKKRKTPPSIEEALANQDFYTSAIGVDAAFTKTADIPIEAPAGATFAMATLGGWAQDVGPNPYQEILVALRKDGKIYIAGETAKKYKDIPACEAVWKDAQTRAEALYKKYTDGGARDQKTFDAYNAINDRADKDYHGCYAERLPKAAFFPELVKEAQAIAARFAQHAP